MTDPVDRLYNLLPAIYRQRDSDLGQPLRALLAIIDEELSNVEADIAGLYENWFIETCDEWVVPYIGDLLGVRGLNDIQTTEFSRRAYVARTLFYRRRKGTAYVLEMLTKDVTGWPAHVVEFFELLQTTQYLNHRRLSNTTPDLRDTNRLDLHGGPFDSLPHTVDVRHISNQRGRYNIPNIGIFLTRLQNYPLQSVTPRRAEEPNSHGYHFSTIGSPAPLFNAPAGEGTAEEQLVPAPIRPLDFYLDLKDYREKYGADQEPPQNSRYYGPERSLLIMKDSAPVPPLNIICKNLESWDLPPKGKVAVDVTRGRITFPKGEETGSVTVSYNYGYSADIGGGPYDRKDRIAEIVPPIREFQVGSVKIHKTVMEALTAWEEAGNPPAVIRIYDSATYNEDISVSLPKKGSLVIDSENGQRPTLVCAASFVVTSTAASEEESAAFTLSGLLVEGAIEVSGKLHVVINDCTLVPGTALDEDGYPKDPDAASITVVGTDITDLKITISRSITGPLQLPEACRGLTVVDSIIAAPTAKDNENPIRAAIAAGTDAANPGPVTTIERSTVFGKIHVRKLSLASESIFVHAVKARIRQEGCVRFSYVYEEGSCMPPDEVSHRPRRYQCQPDRAIAERAKAIDPASISDAERDEIAARVRPQFTDTRYGRPGFAQLASTCADEIKTGAEDGSEMGVFSMLKQPQRVANLRVALDEYLRFGLEAGIFFYNMNILPDDLHKADMEDRT